MFYDEHVCYRELPWSRDALKAKAVQIGMQSRVVLVSFSQTGMMLYTPEAKSFYFADTKLCKQIREALELFMVSPESQMSLDLTYGGTGLFALLPQENTDGYWEQDENKYKYVPKLSAKQAVESNPFIRKKNAEGETGSDVPAQGRKKPKGE